VKDEFFEFFSHCPDVGKGRRPVCVVEVSSDWFGCLFVISLLHLLDVRGSVVT